MEIPPDSGTSPSMKSNAAPSETAYVELDTRSVFSTTTRQFSSISSSLFSLHAQNPDHCGRERATSRVIDVEADDLGIRGTENVEERDEKCPCQAVP